MDKQILQFEQNNLEQQKEEQKQQYKQNLIDDSDNQSSLHLKQLSEYDFQSLLWGGQNTNNGQIHLNIQEQQQQQKQNGVQKSINTQEFQNYLQENQHDSIFFKDAFSSENDSDENGDNEIQNQKKDSKFQGQQEFPQNLRVEIQKNITNLRVLFTEEYELISNFVELSKNIQDSKKLQDLFEALGCEFNLRFNDKMKSIDNIKLQDEYIQKYLNQKNLQYKQVENEVNYYRNLVDTKTQRQAGRYKKQDKEKEETSPKKFLKQQNDSHQNGNTNLNQISQQINQIPQKNKIISKQFIEDSSSVYDWIVDIDLITNISKGGWTVTLSDKFCQMDKDMFKQREIDSSKQVINKNELEENNENQQKGESEAISKNEEQNQNSENTNNLVQEQYKQLWEGATVAVVGLYDKGKTFVLNNLTNSNLPSGKKVTTKGISFKHVNMDSGTNLILLDTAGSYSPVKIESDLSIVEKEATEMFLLDLVFEISDYFICVVNDFTSLDQRYLDKISRNLQNSPSKTFREIIVIHNLKEVESQEILEHVWNSQVTQIYKDGGVQQTKVAATDPNTKQLLEKHVVWFKTKFTRHVCLVNDDCKLGTNINPWVFSLLKYWLKAVFVPVNRQFSVVDNILNFAAMKLSSYFRTGLTLKLHDTNEKQIKKIKTQDNVQENVRIPQISIDSSGLVNTKPDSFTPTIDIISNDKYTIYMDIPGIQKEDILIYRHNVMTIVKGNKRKPYQDQNKKIEKNERKYGEFTLSFRIPEIYERKWDNYEVIDGVLKIEYVKDMDDIDKYSSQTNNDQNSTKSEEYHSLFNQNN